MTDESRPGSESESETRRIDAESSVTRFLQGLPSRRRLLESPEQGQRSRERARTYGEFAEGVLNNPAVVRAIHLMNEQVLQEIFQTPATDAATLGVLSERLRLITDFQTTLAMMIAEVEQLEFAEQQEAQKAQVHDYFPERQT